MCQQNICCAVCPSQCGVVINNNNTDVPYSLTPQDTLVLLAACAVLIITKDFPPSVLCPGLACLARSWYQCAMSHYCRVPH